MTGLEIRGRGLEKRFGRLTALRSVDFELGPGDAVSILGANGAGKSTLLRILAGLSRPSAGTLEAERHGDGSAQPLERSALRAHVGYVGHATLLYGELTAAENLTFASRLMGRPADRDQVDRLLEAVGLRDVADRRAGGFSRGMAQRLSIARAIAHDPSLVLLDEPFSGLDEGSARRLSEQLGALRAGGRSLVLVTHDPVRAIELTDRALLLHDGGWIACAERDGPARTAHPGAEPRLPAMAFEAGALRERLAAASLAPGGRAA